MNAPLLSPAVDLTREFFARIRTHLHLGRSRRAEAEPRRGEPQELEGRTAELERTIAQLHQEIAERRSVEQALRRSEDFHAAIAAMSDWAFLAHVELDGTLVLDALTEGFSRLLGYTIEELAPLGWQTVVHPDDRATAEVTLQRVLGGETVSLDLRQIDKQGGEHWSHFHVTPVKDAEGRVIRLCGGARDITEQKVAERIMRTSESRLRRATEIDTVGIVFFAVYGRITEANDAFLRMSGFTRADFKTGQLRWEAITPPEWVKRSLEAMRELELRGRCTPYEKECLRKDGSRWWGLFSAAYLSDGEGVEYVIDITDRKRADAELRHHRQSLELLVQERTADLDAANGSLRDEIIERERGESARQELLRQLTNAQEEERRRISRELHDEVGQHLAALMLGLRSLSDETTPNGRTTLEHLRSITEQLGREVHELALRLRPTALDDLGLLRTLTNYLEDWSARSHVETDFHSTGLDETRLPPPIEITVYRIVQEALTNVLKHARATRVSVIIERKVEQVVTIIEDNGVGFDLDREGLPNVLPDRKRLGIVGMRERAELIGGELKIESTPRGGTTVFVRLPLAAQPTPNL